MEQKIPDEGPSLTGGFVKLFRVNDDLAVRQFADTEAERPTCTTQYSHHPYAIDRFRELRGLEAIEQPKVVVNAEHEHDWDWVDPDDDDSRAIVCSICGELGEAEDD